METKKKRKVHSNSVNICQKKNQYARKKMNMQEKENNVFYKTLGCGHVEEKWTNAKFLTLFINTCIVIGPKKWRKMFACNSIDEWNKHHINQTHSDKNGHIETKKPTTMQKRNEKQLRTIIKLIDCKFYELKKKYLFEPKIWRKKNHQKKKKNHKTWKKSCVFPKKKIMVVCFRFKKNDEKQIKKHVC